MDKALYVAMTGAKNNMLAQTVAANNLANVSTTGFRADFAQARSMPVYYGSGQPTRAYALTEIPATNLAQGVMSQTGRDLDVAIEGSGFLAVQATDGTEAYTRAGSLYVDNFGMLRTGSGLPVMGNGGPVSIPPAEKIEIALDGTISAVPLGLTAEGLVVVDRIKLVNPVDNGVYKATDGLLRSKVQGQVIPADANVRLISGFLEGSNVNAVSELTDMLELARQYEMQVKLMQTAKEHSESSARLLQNA